ncbi:hypothetical protein PENTCL1PPCAC_4925 [Pristionchus entomophagus]|uniref:Membrane transporter n=1 Tax=Pristionchus entomophagus TaxID=358040 RepID=A0AAV5SJS4_9BILA|nr:hypothetical protein PENTCL1PPCAC_4925 [Pristionchus entomophagus]
MAELAVREPLLRKGTGSTERQSPGIGNGVSASNRENEGAGSVPDASFRTQRTQASDESYKTVGKSVDERPTQWKGIMICGLIMYLTTSMGQTLAVSGWPYLRTIDPTVGVPFLGYVQALTKCGHAIGSCVFAVHAYTTKTFKKALIIGRVLSVVGCAFYIFIELFAPTTRRWAYMLKFLLQSIAEGSLIVVRSYVPRMSQEKDRQQAFSIIEGANMLAIVSGPLVQLVCQVLPEQGTPVVGEWLKFNMYTVPIWISLILNLVTLFIAMFAFKEPELNELEGEQQLPLGQALKKAWQQMKKLDKCLVAMCFLEKSCSSYGFAAMYTTMSAYVTETFNVSESRALLLLSVAQTGAGVMSLVTVAVFVFTPLARVARASYLFPFALSCYFVMYMLSYPWPGITEAIPLRDYDREINGTLVNATNPYGCEANRYNWCGDGIKITERYMWLVVCAVLFGMAIPISLIAFDTIYSKVLGGIDQNIMQGLLIIIDDLALAGAPVVSTKSFEVFGPGPMWLSVAAICAVGLLLWLAIMPKLRKLNI